MGMSSYVHGFRPVDAKWNQMLAIWNACNDADMEIPKEVDDFFDGDSDPNLLPGIEVKIDDAVSEHCADMIDGFDVDITKLPKDVKIIRFTNSY